MLARVAECIYWMSRYTERADAVSRLIDANLTLDLETQIGETRRWEPVLEATGDELAFRNRYPEATRKHVLNFLIFDRENPNSVLECVAKARENARSVRENISTVLWEALNALWLEMREEGMSGFQDEDTVTLLLNRIREKCALINGLTDSSILHDDVWHFASMGRYLERADKTSRFLDAKLIFMAGPGSGQRNELELIEWVALLRSVSGHEMFNRFSRHIHTEEILRFLIFHREFPRSVLYCLKEIVAHLEPLSGGQDSETHQADADAGRELHRLISDMEYLGMPMFQGKDAHTALDELQLRLNRIGLAISDRYFSHE